jgi:hypothetical protein
MAFSIGDRFCVAAQLLGALLGERERVGRRRRPWWARSPRAAAGTACPRARRARCARPACGLHARIHGRQVVGAADLLDQVAGALGDLGQAFLLLQRELAGGVAFQHAQHLAEAVVGGDVIGLQVVADAQALGGRSGLGVRRGRGGELLLRALVAHGRGAAGARDVFHGARARRRGGCGRVTAGAAAGAGAGRARLQGAGPMSAPPGVTAARASATAGSVRPSTRPMSAFAGCAPAGIAARAAAGTATPSAPASATSGCRSCRPWPPACPRWQPAWPRSSRRHPAGSRRGRRA